MSEHLRVVVAVPSCGTWAAGFGVSLVNLVTHFGAKKVPGYGSQELRVSSVVSSLLPRNRLDAVKMAKKLGASHLLFLDSDHSFPADTLHRLVSHKKMVVGANYVMKTIPARPVTMKRSEKPEGEPVYTDPDSYGMERVWIVGTGTLLINMKVFDKIGMGVWDMKYLPESETYLGEDWSFCLACEEAGIPIHIDHDLSKHVKHIGTLEYTHDLVGTSS